MKNVPEVFFRRVPIIVLFIVGLLVWIPGCQKTTNMVLTSNIPDTTFRIRRSYLDKTDIDSWQTLGPGKEVNVEVLTSKRYEIKVQAPNYKEKKVVLTEPLPIYDFKFYEADRYSGEPITNIELRSPTPPLVIPTAGPIKKRYAVVVGISDYQNRGKWGLEKLRYADKDARAITEFLQSPQGGRFDVVIPLINKEAVLQKVKESLRERLRETQADDLILIYWAGHGSPDPHDPQKLYMVTYDTDPEHMPSTAYAMEDFQRDIQKLNSKYILVVADACHSAGVYDPSQGIRGLPENKIVDWLIRGVSHIGPPPVTVKPIGILPNPAPPPEIPRSVLVFTSCETGEKSRESQQLNGGHGVFTYFFLQALQGIADQTAGIGDGDGNLSVGEIIDYTEENVKRFTQNSQHPDTAGNFSRQFILFQKIK
jgi:caspase domain-containing protein